MGSFGKMSTRVMLLLILVAQQQGTMEASRSFPISREVDDVSNLIQSSTVEEGRVVQTATKSGTMQTSDLTTKKKERLNRLEGLLLLLKLMKNQNKYARFT